MMSLQLPSEPVVWPLTPPEPLDLLTCEVCGVVVMASRNGVLYHVSDDSIPTCGERSILAIFRRSPRRHAATFRKDPR